jgi:hypothetical protein
MKMIKIEKEDRYDIIIAIETDVIILEYVDRVSCFAT